MSISPRSRDAARAAGAAAHGPVPQGVFLARLGLFQRTDRLARGQPPARALALIEAARRLAEPAQMGRLFQALAITAPDAPVPAGIRAVNEAEFLTADLPVPHGFFTRRGGVSAGPYASLNCSLSGADARERGAGEPRPRRPRDRRRTRLAAGADAGAWRRGRAWLPPRGRPGPGRARMPP